DTRSAFFYRYLPDNRRRQRGALQDGGTLQALAIDDHRRMNMDFDRGGRRLGIVWRTVSPETPHAAGRARGGGRFNRLEGCCHGGGAIWFADTVGGEHHLGQLYRYVPGTETLELFIESNDKNRMQSPDSLCVAPWGDLLFCEDGS